jgi:hypothetical protein
MLAGLANGATRLRLDQTEIVRPSSISTEAGSSSGPSFSWAWRSYEVSVSCVGVILSRATLTYWSSLFKRWLDKLWRV